MKKIFLSYSRKDEVFARLLTTDLARLGATFWIDVNDIVASEEWRSAVRLGMDSSDVMLLVVSPDSMVSDHVREEWVYFLKQGKPVIPVLWQCDYTILPEQLEPINYVDFATQSYASAREYLRPALERHGIHLYTEEEWKRLMHPRCLRKQSELPRLPVFAASARSIDVLSVSSISLATSQAQFLADKIAEQCRFRIIMLDPLSEMALGNWARYSHRPPAQTPAHIEETLDEFARIPDAETYIRIKYLDFHFSFNLFGIDIYEDTGIMLIGYYAYGQSGASSRPHVVLRKQQDPDWFAFYVQQFETAWNMARSHDWDAFQQSGE